MGPFPSLSLYQRTIMTSLIPSTSWRDNKLYHDVSFDIAPNRLAVMMIALSLLHSHHYKCQLSTIMSSPFEHYKNPTETYQRGGNTVSSLTYSLSLSLRVSIHSKVWLRLRRVCPNNPSGHLRARKQRAQIPASEQELLLSLPNGGIHHQLTRY